MSNLIILLIKVLLLNFPEFTGEIIINHVKEDNEAYLHDSFFLDRGKDYKEYLKTTEIFIICGDTLISFALDMSLDTFATYIQVKDNLFKKSSQKEGFIKLGYNTAIGKVKKFERVNGSKTMLGRRVKKHLSFTPSGNIEYESYIDTEVIYSQYIYKYLFAKVFTQEGLLVNNKETYLPKNKIKYSTIKSIIPKQCNCNIYFENLGFH
jgi:hypothetical protein